jgi:hypothetical protein
MVNPLSVYRMRTHPFRPGDLALALVSVAAMFFVLTLAAASLTAAGGEWTAKRQLVGELGLTDLCLVTEARYTRHLSLADRHAPFQDHPMALEHFPSGAFLSPPPHLTAHAPLAR